MWQINSIYAIIKMKILCNYIIAFLMHASHVVGKKCRCVYIYIYQLVIYQFSFIVQLNDIN